MRAQSMLVCAAVAAASACLVEIKTLQPGSGGAGSTASQGGGATTGGGEMTAGAAGGAGATAPCPSDMVHIEQSALAVSFCIDKTEVTWDQYVGMFLLAVGDVPPAGQPAACAGNTTLTHTPDGTCPEFSQAGQLPIYCVDWCDALAYCTWAGKRLCGALADGGPLGFDDDPVQGEWHFACSAGLTQAYPYGDTPLDVCHIDDMIGKDAVGDHPSCEGGFAEMFDMQGNVHEWINACNAAGECRFRGGGTYGSSTQWSCDRVEGQTGQDRLDPDNRTVGVRCCADAR